MLFFWWCWKLVPGSPRRLWAFQLSLQGGCRQSSSICDWKGRDLGQDRAKDSKGKKGQKGLISLDFLLPCFRDSCHLSVPVRKEWRVYWNNLAILLLSVWVGGYSFRCGLGATLFSVGWGLRGLPTGGLAKWQTRRGVLLKIYNVYNTKWRQVKPKPAILPPGAGSESTSTRV